MLSMTSASAQPTPIPTTESSVRRRLRVTLRTAYRPATETMALSVLERARGLEPRGSHGWPHRRQARRHDNGGDNANDVDHGQTRIQPQREIETECRDLGRPAASERGKVQARLVHERDEPHSES